MVQAGSIQLTLITPERKVLERTVDSVVIPAHDGELGVLRNRASLMCELGVGRLRFNTAEGPQQFFIDGGFAQVHANNVALLTDQAIEAGDVNNELIAEYEQRADRAPQGGADRLRARRRVSVLRVLRQTH